MNMEPFHPLEEDQEAEQSLRGTSWIRWVALLLVLAMVLATPFIYVFSRRGREPRQIRVPGGETVVLSPGAAQPGDAVRCASGAGAVVPDRGEGVSGFADGPSSSSSIAIEVAMDGTVTVSCGL
ncbi:MAG: hypothetical protein ACE14W_10315 [Candidatus Velamenicoccus archaeovorus]